MPGCHISTSSIFFASAKSFSVMPLAAWFISFTVTNAYDTLRSGWCQAASARWPTVLTTISVPFQPLVLYLRRIQPSSKVHFGSSAVKRASTSSGV